MANYSFISTWRIPYSAERVWAVLFDAPEQWREWWPGMVSYTKITPGETRVGTRLERVVRGRLPYSLRYVTTITHLEPLREVAYDSEGDLVGDGRMIVTPTNDGTEVVWHWNVRTQGFWINLFAPLLKPLFAWNHNRVMNDGERGLTAWLARS